MISEQAYALCRAIEELPASEKQTQISVMAADLRTKVAEVEGELVEIDKLEPLEPKHVGLRLSRRISAKLMYLNNLSILAEKRAEAAERERDAARLMVDDLQKLVRDMAAFRVSGACLNDLDEINPIVGRIATALNKPAWAGR